MVMAENDENGGGGVNLVMGGLNAALKVVGAAMTSGTAALGAVASVAAEEAPELVKEAEKTMAPLKELATDLLNTVVPEAKPIPEAEQQVLTTAPIVPTQEPNIVTQVLGETYERMGLPTSPSEPAINPPLMEGTMTTCYETGFT